MKVTKAVITAAGKTQRHLPLQTLIDRDGAEKSVLEILISEAIKAGISDVGVVIDPADTEAYQAVVGRSAAQVSFIPQAQKWGHGHAVYCAHQFTDGKPFLHLVGDHLYVSKSAQGCCLLYTSPSPRDLSTSRMPSSA